MNASGSARIEQAIGEFPLFSGLEPGLRRELARAARVVALQREQAIFRAGDIVADLHLLLSGLVKLALSCHRGTERVIDVVEPGQAFGAAEILGARPSLVAAIAVKPSRVLCISREALSRVMERDPRLALRMMKSLAERQVDMETESAERHSLSGSQRVLEFLLRRAGPARDPVGETPVTLGINKQLLAARFGMQPESLSRTLRDLADAGLIAPDGARIRLKNTAIGHYLAADPASRNEMIPSRRRLRYAAARGDAGAAALYAARTRVAEGRAHHEAINKAGRQRMLSQRMAKSWLMLQRGVMARRSRLILRQSMDQFEGQLHDLDVLAGSEESRAARANLAEIWRPYRALLGAPPAGDLAHELFAINEKVLGAAQELTLAIERDDGTRHAALVNLAGRQRMLSQRMAKFYLFLELGLEVSRSRAELHEAGAEFSTALAQLVADTADQPAIRAELAAVESLWGALQGALSSRSGPNSTLNARTVFKVSEDILQHLDVAVDLFARLHG